MKKGLRWESAWHILSMRGWVQLGCIQGVRELGQKGLERLGEAGLLGVTKAKQRSDIQRGRLLEQTVIW